MPSHFRFQVYQETVSEPYRTSPSPNKMFISDIPYESRQIGNRARHYLASHSAYYMPFQRLIAIIHHTSVTRHFAR